MITKPCRYCGKLFESQPHAKQTSCSIRCALLSRPTQKNTEARFWSKVEKTPTCWVWKAGKKGSTPIKSYGHFWIGEGLGVGRNVTAHRYSWELHYGPIPDGLNVLHKCDNPPCIRPDHLFLGTDADNNYDKVNKGRNISHCGERCGMSKLTESEVAEIRLRLSRGETQVALGRAFGVSHAAISYILHRKTWKHAPPVTR